MEKDILTQTIAHRACNGKGCSVCNKSGVEIDNTIAELIKKYVDRSAFLNVLTNIYDQIGRKLVDAYERGYKDGKKAQRLSTKKKYKRVDKKV